MSDISDLQDLFTTFTSSSKVTLPKISKLRSDFVQCSLRIKFKTSLNAETDWNFEASKPGNVISPTLLNAMMSSSPVECAIRCARNPPCDVFYYDESNKECMLYKRTGGPPVTVTKEWFLLV